MTLAACGESHSNTDAGPDGSDITFDATIDAGPVYACGNGELEPGEMCDDGNTVATDSCDNDCIRTPFCGDGVEDVGETCDDANNRSGDGCRADCQSDETCGNGIIDFQAEISEVCDPPGGTCAADCLSVTGCGDGTVMSPEVCDDGDGIDPPETARWDGCDAACQEEIAMIIDSMSLARRSEGCDLTGDGNSDNAFATALGLLSAAFDALIGQTISSGQLSILLAWLGLDDAAGANDSDFRIAWLVGNDVDGDVTNNFTGNGMFFVGMDALNADGSARTSIQSAVAANTLTGGPEDIPLPFGFFDIQLQEARIEGTTFAAGGELNRLGMMDQEALLCGGIPVQLLALLGTFFSGGGAGGALVPQDPPCDGGEEANLVDLIIGGGTATASFGDPPMMFPLSFGATAPDLDLDGDGLEDFQLTGGTDCQPVVTNCVDGDGEDIPGRNCFTSPAIGDGYSAAFHFTAIRALLAGVAP